VLGGGRRDGLPSRGCGVESGREEEGEEEEKQKPPEQQQQQSY